jgi:hypothetical protein
MNINEIQANRRAVFLLDIRTLLGDMLKEAGERARV